MSPSNAGMASYKAKIALPVFEGKDWRSWSVQAKALLMTKRLWGTVKQRPTPEQAATETWSENNDQAMGYLLQMVHPAYHFVIVDSSSAAGMWIRLQENYGQADRGTYDASMTDWINFSVDSSEEPVKFGARLLQIVQQLNVVSQELSISPKAEAETVHRLLMAVELTGNYDAIVQVLKNSTGVTVHRCIRDLQHAYEVGKKREAILNQTAVKISANATIHPKHVQRYNPPNVPQERRTTPTPTSSFSGRCFWCQKKGHRLADCRAKKAGRPKVQRDQDEEAGNNTIVVCGQGKKIKEPAQAFITISSAFGTAVEEDWKKAWILDTGATRHMTGNREHFTTLQDTEKKISVLLGNDNQLKAEGEGPVEIKTVDGILRLAKVLYVPGLRRNLISYGQAEQDGFSFTNSKSGITLEHSSQMEKIHARREKNLYIVTSLDDDQEQANAIKMIKGSSLQWHYRLGHAGASTLAGMQRTGAVLGMEKTSSSAPGEERCEWCQRAKQTRQPFSKERRNRETLKVLSIVSSDLCGPLTTARDGSKYFLTFTDESSNYTVVISIRSKSDTFQAFKKVLAWMERASEKKMKALRTDGGGEYTSSIFKNFLMEQGIDHIMTAPGTPQDNGGAERKNRTLLETMRSIMMQAGMPENLWTFALKGAAYIRNRTGYPKTPYERFIGEKPNISNLRPIGCKAWVHVPKNHRSKLHSQAEEAVLVGYEVGSRNYLLMRRDFSVFTSRDVEFDEHIFPMRLKNQQERNHQAEPSVPLIDSDLETDTSDEEETHEEGRLQNPEPQEQPPQEQEVLVQPEVRQTRARRPPGEWWRVQANNSNICHIQEYALSVDSLPTEPKSYQEAISGKDSIRWKNAMQEEMESLLKNEVWELVPLPKDRKPISCKWIYKIKMNPDQSIERFKARLVVRGFSQKHGIDFAETFAPVAKYTSLRLLFGMAVQFDLHILQLDIKTAFLYGDLQEETFMDQPEGFTVGENLVCKLKKTLYGLKQAPRGWNSKIHSFLMSIGFERTVSDHCVYIQEETILLLWVDDILLFGSESKNHQIQKRIASTFDVSLIGAPKRVVGLHVNRRDHQMDLHQSVYASEVLKRFGMEDSKPMSTPLTKVDTSEEASQEADRELFMQFLGSVMFLAVGTRPDLSFAISTLSRAMQQPTVGHWVAAKHLLRYLSGTRNLGLTFNKCKKFPDIQIYADADWANNEDRKSISGIVCTLGGTAISWISKKQSTVALSTTEAEYQALTEAAKEALWIRSFLQELKHPVSEPTIIWNDNTGAIALSQDPVHHGRTKHIEIKHHFIRNLIQDRVISVQYKPTHLMPADLLTKTLPRTATVQHRQFIGLKNCGEEDHQEEGRQEVDRQEEDHQEDHQEKEREAEAAHGVCSEGGYCG